MHLNIAQKIFGISAIVLVLMALVAMYSIRLTAGISADLRSIAARHMPASRAVESVRVMSLEQGVVLQRIFVLNGDSDTDAKSLRQDRARFQGLSAEIARGFSETDAMLSRNNETQLAKHLTAIEDQYKAFEAHGLQLIQAREANDRKTLDSLMASLNDRQDAIIAEIARLHDHMASVADTAIAHADKEERNLLVANSMLTALATILAITFSALVTRMIVRAIRDLAAGAEAVEEGHLDTVVTVTTHDEVGKLTYAFNNMVGGLRLKERIKDTFGKYMDPRIVAGLLDHPEFTEPGGERREMSVMFIDLKGFTTISEVLEPQELVGMVNDFYSHMTDAISQNYGVVDKYMGDAVMAYWGPPFCEAGEHARLACRAAMQALAKLDAFRADVRAMLGPKADRLDIGLRIGVSTGDMIVGTIGSKDNRNFTVMGDPVNLGARLEGACKVYGTRVLISQRTRELAGAGTLAREIDLIRVKGKTEPIRVYELLDENHQAPSLEDGLKAYRARDWDLAEAAFSKTPPDNVSAVYLERIAKLRHAPPRADWDGVWVLDTK